jgi:hypothetical protein
VRGQLDRLAGAVLDRVREQVRHDLFDADAIPAPTIGSGMSISMREPASSLARAAAPSPSRTSVASATDFEV